MKTITLKINGMHCVSCAMTIDGDLEDNVPGVKFAKTNYAKQECEVAFDETKASAASIAKQIKQTGYTSEVTS